MQGGDGLLVSAAQLQTEETQLYANCIAINTGPEQNDSVPDDSPSHEPGHILLPGEQQSNHVPGSRRSSAQNGDVALRSSEPGMSQSANALLSSDATMAGLEPSAAPFSCPLQAHDRLLDSSEQRQEGSEQEADRDVAQREADDSTISPSGDSQGFKPKAAASEQQTGFEAGIIGKMEAGNERLAMIEQARLRNAVPDTAVEQECHVRCEAGARAESPGPFVAGEGLSASPKLAGFD